MCGADGVNYKHAYRFGQAQFVTALIVDGKKTTAATGGSVGVVADGQEKTAPWAVCMALSWLESAYLGLDTSNPFIQIIN